MFVVRLAVGVDQQRFFGEDCDCEESRPATPFREAKGAPFH
jgi:hypothetical protein